MNEYRQISVVAKVLEGIICDQLLSAVCSVSTETKMVSSMIIPLDKATDNRALNINRGDVHAIVFLKLKKTFDTVYQRNAYTAALSPVESVLC